MLSHFRDLLNYELLNRSIFIIYRTFHKNNTFKQKYLCIYNWYRFTNLNSLSINCSENIQKLYNYKPHTLLKYPYLLKELEGITLRTQHKEKTFDQLNTTIIQYQIKPKLFIDHYIQYNIFVHI